MQHSTYHKDLLVSLDKFVQQMQQLNKADDPKLVSQLVIRWTKAQPLLTKKLLQYVLEYKPKISLGEEANTVEKIVKNRLIKEFKQDELTLHIRQLLYTKDLISLIGKTQGNINIREQIYLKSLQNELGLSDRQCQLIKQRYLPPNSLVEVDVSEPKRHNEIIKFNHYEDRDSYQDLILLMEKSPGYNLLTPNEDTISQREKPTISNLCKSKKFWFWLISPLLLLLFIRNFNWAKITQVTTTADVTQGSCANLINSRSPRMSLGEKLLTQKYKYSPPQLSGKIALSEATTAFAQCKYSIAARKFQTSLNIEKNNPEALIYLNNATSIVRDHFKIAVSVPLGSKPGIAREILRGVAQAQTKINRQGGIEGKLLLVQIVDDDNDSKIVRQVAKQLTADRDILAVIGHNDSDASIAASDIYQRQGLVMISPTSTSTKLSGIGSYIMRTTPSVAVLANTLASYALISNYSKVAICSDPSSSASNSFAEEFTAEMIEDGGEILPVECDLSQENFNPVPAVEQAISQNADALLLAASVGKNERAIAVARANQQRLPLLGNHTLYTFETIQAGKEAVGGMVLSVPWLPGTIPNNDFSETTTKFWGGKVNWRTAMAYDATKAIIQGLKQSDSRAQLQSVLTKPDFQVNGATGSFRFKQGDRLGEVQLAYIAKPDENQNKYHFAKLNVNDKINRLP